MVQSDNATEPSPRRRAVELDERPSVQHHDLVTCARGFGPQGCHLGRAQDVFPIGFYNREYSGDCKNSEFLGVRIARGALPLSMTVLMRWAMIRQVASANSRRTYRRLMLEDILADDAMCF